VNSYVVVDASLAIKWVLREPYADEALALAGEWVVTETRPVAPCLLLVEATNVLHRRGHRGQGKPTDSPSGPGAGPGATNASCLRYSLSGFG